uniref:Uncharacterized protein n=1 Tax=Tetranychus urticae TaxID=32264 RepID=T1KSX8_TETUR
MQHFINLICNLISHYLLLLNLVLSTIELFHMIGLRPTLIMGSMVHLLLITT